MLPSLATTLAVRAWPWRAHTLLVSVLVIGLAAATTFATVQWPARLAFTLIGPVVGLSWSLLCVASWFHPTNGALAPAARVFGRLPSWLQSILRWYASVFLALFFVVCLSILPVFLLSNLLQLAG
jgi:hypothetical protein